MKHSGSDQLLLMVRLMQGSVQTHTHFSSHPGAAGTFFTLLLLGLKICECVTQTGFAAGNTGVQLLRDRIYRWECHCVCTQIYLKSDIYDYPKNWSGLHSMFAK